MPTFQLKGNYCTSACRGCEKKIGKILSKTKGIRQQNIDLKNGLVHVEGDLDIKTLEKKLQDKFRSAKVHAVENEKQEDEKTEGGSSSTSKPGPAPEHVELGGPTPQEPVPGYSGCGDHDYGPAPGYSGYGGQDYGAAPGYGNGYWKNADQIFSDENPNACSMM
ncbi:heavy metal-associated isoprenylated plant protein 3-like [Hevea brasiliensis]|uniref:heavy metal-associated isoprenylated plant protein 3-like n=1 Tax=Hevea brasiliensis TaxID=3981 RepID=UPI000B781206|nr:heavy metal-associated isoprenylated plant protein 3-like [Hevea brasiliensis]